MIRQPGWRAGLVAALCLWLAGAATAEPGPVLRGVVLLPDAIAGSGAVVDGIEQPATGVLSEEALAAHLRGLLGRPLNQALMEEIHRRITARFVAAGHPFVDIGFPPQDVTDGILRVVAAEYRVGRVAVEGNAWFSAETILAAAGLKAGETIHKPRLDRRLALLGDSPFLKVVPEFGPGETPGTTNVVLRATDRVPVQVSAGYRNSGNAATGWGRWDVGVSHGNAFGGGETLALQTSASRDVWERRLPGGNVDGPGRFASYGVSLIRPFADGGRLTASGSFARQSPALGPSLGSIGLNSQVGLEAALPVAWLGATGEEAGVGLEMKRSNNNLAFGGEQVQHGYTLVSQAALRWQAGLQIGHAVLQIRNALVLSPGGIGPGNSDAAFRPAGLDQSGLPGARARYAYDRLVLTGLVPLPADYGLVLRTTMQATTATLLASEQMPIAGADAVRGYQEFSVAGSQGALFSAELRAPRFSLPSIRGADDNAQLHGFVEAGRAWNPVASAAAPAARSTAAIGIGGQIELGDWGSLRIDQGWQLLRARSGPGGGFVHASVDLRW